MDFRSFMLVGVDGELNFLPTKRASEGRNSLSAKYVNNNAPMIDATPLSSLYPLNVVENGRSTNFSCASLSLHPEGSKKFKILGKRKVASGVPGKALPPKVQKYLPELVRLLVRPLLLWMLRAILISMELKNATDCHRVVAHVTLSSWKQHRREISIEQLCDINDRAYM
nr:hypothetical protein [Tanacetum cinerariifolium]